MDSYKINIAMGRTFLSACEEVDREWSCTVLETQVM